VPRASAASAFSLAGVLLADVRAELVRPRRGTIHRERLSWGLTTSFAVFGDSDDHTVATAPTTR
jgi:hypothetical protein